MVARSDQTLRKLPESRDWGTTVKSTRSTLHLLRLVAAVVLTLTLTLPTGSASAEGFDLQQFHPMPDQRNNYFGTASATVAPHLAWSAMALFNYANDPLVLRDADGERIESLVSQTGTLHLLFSLGLLDVLELGVDLPMIALQDGTAFPNGGLALEDSSFGLGDLRLVPKVRLFSTQEHPLDSGVALALLVDLHLPTGDEDSLQGGDFRVGPRLAFDVNFGGPRIGANFGYLYRPGTALENVTVDDTLGWSVAGEVPVSEAFRLTGEVFGRFTPSADGINRSDSPTEFLAGGKADVGHFLLVAGAGAGLINGYGTPDWRAFIGLGAATPRTRPEPLPEPEPEPEPEPDCRTATVATDCPDVPATVCTNGVLHTYSAVCADGECTYPVQEIRCAAGTICGEDDGVPACVPEPDCTSDDDCTAVPQPTCTDGRLTTWSGRCEEGECHYDETVTECGEGMECGIDDGVPACVPEPEPMVVRVDVETRRIELDETVFFATGSAEIETRSFNMLNQVADVLESNPQIRLVRIEGHTDSRGSRTLNTRLSRERADSVREYLIRRGIAPERLFSEGFGPDRPIADNNTADGRAQNRRVELHIVEQD
ncbi:MAG: hypothetical protein EA398_06965 [Deltaproteobacteria bacterium]|nr:MAG: hypothetical protein EA398_06965 [Deltaproteobacteria bacterium]